MSSSPIPRVERVEYLNAGKGGEKRMTKKMATEEEFKNYVDDGGRSRSEGQGQPQSTRDEQQGRPTHWMLGANRGF